MSSVLAPSYDATVKYEKTSGCTRPQEIAKIRLDNPDFACEEQAA